MRCSNIFQLAALFSLSGCFDDQKITPSAICTHRPNDNLFAGVIPESKVGDVSALPRLGAEFTFGVATAAYQIESGNAYSDWAEWEDLGKVKNNDFADDGPQSDRFYAADIAAMRELKVQAYRLSIEWSRLFPTRADFDALRPDPEALAYYRTLLEALVAVGIRPMVTLQHFTLPLWLQSSQVKDRAQGLADPEFPALLAKFAGFAAEQFGDLVDEWITLNEPLATAAAGYAVAQFPPGRAGDFKGMQQATIGVARAHALAYDTLHAVDRADADGDGTMALVSFATHARLWLPYVPGKEDDVTAARRQRYINNLVTLDAVVCGNVDADWDEKWETEADSQLKGRLDFIALNYYSTAAASYLNFEPFLSLPLPANLPTGKQRNDLGWDLAPEGLRAVLDELKPYGLPVVITENGVADAADNRRPKNLIDTVAEIQAARRDGYDIRGYYHWTLVDNFEWAYGFCPRFGLYSVDFSDPLRTRVARSSAGIYRELIEANGVTAAMTAAHPTYGADVTDCQ